MRYFLYAIALGIMFGCSMPATTVKSVDSRPKIAIEGGPKNAEVFIDGVLVGISGDFDGRPNVLTIEQGTHQIIVKEKGQIIYQQNFFVDSELKTFKIH